MRENLIRGFFSFIAAAVTLSMAQEWGTWALEQRRFWKLIPASILAVAACFEAHQVWGRSERILGLSYAGRAALDTSRERR